MPAVRFRCPDCSAGMEFDPEKGKLKCGYCGAETEVPEDGGGALREIPYTEYGRAEASPISADAVEVTCGGCGATVQFEPPEVAGVCPFCAAAIVGQPKAADPLIAPHGVLPFALPRAAGNKAVRQWLQGLWFAPGKLKQLAQTEALQGVYLPYWTFDAETESEYRGEHGTHYWETEVYKTVEDGRTVQKTRQVMRTRWRPASGSVAVPFDDVLVPATRAIPGGRLDELQPWGMEQIRVYEPGFLAGFKAQRYQLELPKGLERAKEIMQVSIVEACRRDIGGDEQRVHEVRTGYRNLTFKHILLPVWIGAYRFQGKVYQVVVNGQSGEVHGERPYSAGKIALAVLAALFTALLVFLLTRQS